MSDQPVLIHGDCFEVMPTLRANSIHFAFCDLPYATKKHRHTRNIWDVTFNLPEFWKIKSPFLDNAVFTMTASQPFTTQLILSNLDAFKYCLVWDKKFSGSFVKANTMPLRVHEDIVVFCKGTAIYNPQKTLRVKPIKLGSNGCKSMSSPIAVAHNSYKQKVYADKHPTSIITVSNRSDKRGLHPTQKPIALLEFLIKSYTNPGDTVLDPVAGSGSTAIAAMRTGRRAICIEKDPTYFEAMTKRVAEERRQMDLSKGSLA